MGYSLAHPLELHRHGQFSIGLRDFCEDLIKLLFKSASHRRLESATYRIPGLAFSGVDGILVLLAMFFLLYTTQILDKMRAGTSL